MGAQIWTLSQKVKAKFPTQDNRETFRGKFCRQGSFVTVPFFALALVGLASWYSRLRALALIFFQLPTGPPPFSSMNSNASLLKGALQPLHCRLF